MSEPRCPTCHGKGGWRDGFGWRTCPCRRPTKAAKAAHRRLNSAGAKYPQLNLDAMRGHDDA